MRRVLLVLGCAWLLAACEVEDCVEGSLSKGGVCFPEDPAAALFMPTCGNNICERRGKVKEDATTCPADCDGGYSGRALLIAELTGSLYNDHVANRSWPAGRVDTSGACKNGGTSTIRGTSGRVGDDNSHMLDFQMTGCAIDLASFIGSITVTGGPISRAATFNNVRDTATTRITGSAMLTGVDGRGADAKTYAPVACSFDFTEVRTSSAGGVNGSMCGKPIRKIVYDQ